MYSNGDESQNLTTGHSTSAFHGEDELSYLHVSVTEIATLPATYDKRKFSSPPVKIKGGASKYGKYCDLLYYNVLDGSFVWFKSWQKLSLERYNIYYKKILEEFTRPNKY